MRDVISIRDFGKKDIERYFKKTAEMERVLKKRKRLLRNVVVATAFFEPSTRTRLSFQTAATRLGAEVIDFSVEISSAKKGESFVDTIRTIDGYADLIIVRHPLEGSARLAAEVAEHPVINGGDGGNQHPTQTLIDLYSIKKLKGKIGGLNVHLVGDLKHARSMRSLLYGLGMFGANITLSAPKGLEMAPEIIDETKKAFNAKIAQNDSITLKDCDVLYVCRIQKERFADPYAAERVKKEFMITEDLLKGAPEEMIILHPLPKVDEIPPSVDKSKRAKYFEQARYGVPVRMALIADALRG